MAINGYYNSYWHYVALFYYGVLSFQEFNNIFSSLLPGTKAQLVPPEGQTILDGLQFRVAFGDTWKESLSELSGGQR